MSPLRTASGGAVFVDLINATPSSVSAQGLPVLWVHGQLNDARGLLGPARRVAEARSTPWAAVDLPGHGAASSAPCDDAEVLARVIVEALDVLQWPQAAVVGHSLGGWALQDAMLDVAGGERIVHGVLVGCPNDLSESARAEFRGFADLIDADGFPEPVVGIALQRWYGHRSGHIPEALRDTVRTQLHANNRRAAAQVFRATAARRPTLPRLAGLKGRLTVVVGGEDVIVEVSEAAAVADAAGAPLHVIAGASHFPFVDTPDLFHDLIVGTLGARRTG
jgi:pimeloyl-ACP methyl ester carboxylesterase